MVGVTERLPPVVSVRARLVAQWADVAFAALLVVLAAYLLYHGRGTTFYFDEWSIWTGRYGASPDRWLRDVNGHLCPVPVLVFTTLSKVFGAETLTPFRI